MPSPKKSFRCRPLPLGLSLLALAACGQNTGNIAGTPPGQLGGLASCDAIAGAGGGEDSGGQTGPLMRPGQNCLCCHSFTAAGTVFTSSGAGANGVTVSIGGLTLTTNAAGNFFTSAPITFPASVSVQSANGLRAMPMQAPGGACSSCHGAGTPQVTSP